MKHKNFIIIKIRFFMETDHHTYIICHCGTSIVEQSLEEIWNVLMHILNHFEAMLIALAPSKFIFQDKHVE